MLIYFLFWGVATAQGAYFPLFVQQLEGSTTMVGTIILFFTLSEIPIIYFSDQILRKIPYKYLMLFACILSLIRFAWYATCPSPQMMGLIFFFQGLTGNLFMLVSVKVILILVEYQYVNSAYGFSSMLAKGISALIFQMMAGKIIDTFSGIQGYQWTYLLYAFIMILCIGLCLKIKDKRTVK